MHESRRTIATLPERTFAWAAATRIGFKTLQKHVAFGKTSARTPAEIEMRWIDAWKAMHEILAACTGISCGVPDGSIVDFERSKA